MNDKKLLSVTNIRINKNAHNKETKKLLTTSKDENSNYLFTGLGSILSNEIPTQNSTTLPILPLKGLPAHIFSKKKPRLPKRVVYHMPAWTNNPPVFQNCDVSGDENSVAYEDLEKHRLITIESLSKTVKHAPARLQALHKQFEDEQNLMIQHEKRVLMETLYNGEKMVNKLPLKYLYSKDNLRHFALEKACTSFMVLAKHKYKSLLSYSFHIWRSVKKLVIPTVVMEILNEKQLGYIVLCKIFADKMKKHLRYYLREWSFKTLIKYDVIRHTRFNEAAYLIQHWYKNMSVIKKQPFRDFIEVFQMCLHRRKAIKMAVMYEHKRRKALNKIRKGIATRRRYYFAARAIQRIMRWCMLYRRTTFKLTRSICARRIQRWRRKMMQRPTKELLLIYVGLKAGGHTKVTTRMPNTYKMVSPVSLLGQMEFLISGLQRWYMSRMGKMDLYIRLAKRRKQMEHDAKMNKNATIIQIAYRHRLLHEMFRAMLLNNRCNRIQRAFRTYSYRKRMYYRLIMRKHRYIPVVVKFFRFITFRKKIRKRFVIRKRVLACAQLRRLCSARNIQRRYRAYVIYMTIVKAERLEFFAQQRLRSDVVLKSIETIQRIWRNAQTPSRLARHVLLWVEKDIFRERLLLWKKVRILQKAAVRYLDIRQIKAFELKNRAARKIQKCAKAFSLKTQIFNRVAATRRRRNACAKLIQCNYRMFVWLRKMNVRFAAMKARIELHRLRMRMASRIQYFIRKQYKIYYLPLRVAARRQLKKKREMACKNAILELRKVSACVIQKLFRQNSRWAVFIRRMKKLRRQYLEKRMANRLAKNTRAYLARLGLLRKILERREKHRLEQEKKRFHEACNVIGRYWKRSVEKSVLKVRFQFRKKNIEDLRALEAEKAKVEQEKQDALEEIEIQDENMKATIKAAWKQGSDARGVNYYYNYVTGESTWELPKDWNLQIIDAWIRNVDERGQVYYYNQQSGESRWLPPCVKCGKESDRWCLECGVAYCVEDHVTIHDKSEDEEMMAHKWSATELSKETLKQGEVYCCECKKRAATCVCTVCWDYYCDSCFKFVHHVGELRNHPVISYKKSKQGWVCVKPVGKGEAPYYVNGKTGQTSYQKPRELMNPTELEYFNNFESHRKAAEEHVEKIEKLQYELEAVKYERDRMLVEGGGAARRNMAALKSEGKQENALNQMMKEKAGFFDFFSGLPRRYKEGLMKPDPRERGKNRSDYIKSILDQPLAGTASPNLSSK